jgi:2-oxoglutarate ferredoxin oxidoreductase subunit gamma
MVGKKDSRGEVLMAGLGGMGVLVSGQVLLEAAFHSHEHVSYVSSYGFARRGGLCECTVIFSDDKISSPLLDQAGVVMLLDSSQFPMFEHRVRPGGIMLADEAGLNAERRRDDYTLYALPCLEIATSMGSILGKNLVMLGAYVAITESVSPQLIEEEMKKRFAGNEKVLNINLEAFRRGLELGKSRACACGDK